MMDNVNRYTKSKRTKENILQSAIKLMQEHGFTNTTIRDICANAGVSVGTFYSYFPRKEDIFADIFSFADDYFLKTVSAELSGSTIREKIVDYFKYYARLNSDTGIETMKVLYNSDNTWFIKSRPMQEVLINLIETGQRNGELVSDTSAEDIASFLFILARGCCYGWCVVNGTYDLEEQLTDYISRALSIYETRK